MHTDPAVSKDMNGAPPHEIRLSRETAGGCEATVPYECCGKLVSECSTDTLCWQHEWKKCKKCKEFAKFPIIYTT